MHSSSNSPATLTSLFCALLLALLAPRAATAAQGDLDLTFNGTGKVLTSVGTDDDYASTIALHDGKIVAAGFSRMGGNYDFLVARYNPNGSLDPTFGGTGKVTTPIGTGDDTIGGVAVQSDGRIVVAGAYATGAGTTDLVVARYKENGDLDGTFGTGGKATYSPGPGNDYCDRVALQSDGKIVVVAHSYSATLKIVVLRYDTNGNLDPTFNGTGVVNTSFAAQSIPHAIAIQSDDKILVTGLTGSGNNAYDIEILRYEKDGPLDTSFNGNGRVTAHIRNGNNYGNAICEQSDHKIVVAGLAGTEPNYDIVLLRYNPGGTLDTTFNTTGIVTTPLSTGDDSAGGVFVQSDGRIIVGGFSYNGSNYDYAVLRYEADGDLDSTFNGTGKVVVPIGPGDDIPGGMVVQGDGKIVLGGYSYNGTNYDVSLARFLGADAAPIPFTAAATDLTPSSATLNGSVNPLGLAATVYFEYGTTFGVFPFTAPVPNVGSGTSPANVAASIAGLMPDTAYYYRLVATNSAGTAVSGTATLTTLGIPLEVTTTAATKVTGTSATLNATINPHGLTATIAFDYDEDPTFATPNVIQVPGVFAATNPQSVSVAIGGLAKDTTYYFRARATVGTQTSAASSLSFTTANTAPVAVNDTPVFFTQDAFNINVLANDFDPDGDTLHVASVTQPSDNASHVDITGNILSFQVQSPFKKATFTYTISDGILTSQPATVSVFNLAAVSGTYEGFLGDGTSGSGSVRLTIDSAGASFTAEIRLDGQTYRFKSSFANLARNGATFGPVVVKGTNPPLTLTLSIDPENFAITGRLASLDPNGNFDEPLDLLRIDDAPGADAPSAGAYSGFLDPVGVDPLDSARGFVHANGGIGFIFPEGSGFTVIRVHHKKRKSPATFVGRLNDGTKFSAGLQGTTTDRRGASPKQQYRLSTNPYAQPGGSLRTFAEVNLGDKSLSDTTGRLIRPPAPDGSQSFGGAQTAAAGTFVQGFSLTFSLQAFLFKNLGPHPMAFDFRLTPANARLVFSQGGISGDLTSPGMMTAPIYVNRRDQARFVSDSQRTGFKLHLLAPTPFFTGTLQRDDGSGQVDKFFGVIRRDSGGHEEGRGHFTGTDLNGKDRTGLVKLLKN